MTRRDSRILVFELLYECALRSAEDPETILQCAEQIRDVKLNTFGKTVFDAWLHNAEQIDSEITESSKSWSVARMNPVAKAILRMSAGEMLYTDVPTKVAINEAMEIAKVYDDGKSPAFINGILNDIGRRNGKISEGE